MEKIEKKEGDLRQELKDFVLSNTNRVEEKEATLSDAESEIFMNKMLGKKTELEELLKSQGLNPKDYSLFHIASGSTPPPTVKYEDTKDGVIEKFIRNKLFAGLFEEEDGGDEDGDGDGEGVAA